jgi:hypothetical protein
MSSSGPVAEARRDEPLRDDAVEHREQRIPEAVHVVDRDRLRVDAELLPCPGLEELLERARAAGQHHERVAQLGHPHLALVHVRDDLEARQVVVSDLLVDERLGDHSDHLAARRAARARHRAHQPDVAAAVDQSEAGAGDRGADGRRRCEICGVGTARGSGENDDTCQSTHAPHDRGADELSRNCDGPAISRRHRFDNLRS